MVRVQVMRVDSVAFSLVGQAACVSGEAAASAIPPMLRRRAGALGKMALQVASEALAGHTGIPAVFCSRHGEVARAIALLDDLAAATPLSPTAFGLSVHNAIAGLLSIARSERSNQIALSAGAATIEHGVIEACSLLADGAPLVLLVAYDAPLPDGLRQFEDCAEAPFAFAWLMAPAGAAVDSLRLAWQADANDDVDLSALPGGLAALRFHASGAARMERRANGRRWTWSRNA